MCVDSQIWETHGPDPGIILHRLAQLDQHDIIDGQPTRANVILGMSDDLVHTDVLHENEFNKLSPSLSMCTWCGAEHVSSSQSIDPSFFKQFLRQSLWARH